MVKITGGVWAFPLLALVLLGWWSCRRPEYISFAGEGIGTYYHVTYYDSLGRDARGMVDSVLGAIGLRFSIYDSLSDVSRFNRSRRGVRAAGLVSLMREAISLHRLTGGYFDPTIGPVAKLWGFDGARGAAPDSLLIRALRVSSSMGNLELRGDSLVKLHPDVSLTLNAIAKGYAVDCIAACLEARGVSSYLVEVGGEIRSSGCSPRGVDWIIGVETPARDARVGASFAVRIRLGRAALATSGNYRNYIEQGGAAWGHTMDPTSGYPATNTLLSATVLDSSCMRADALATALMAMGLDGAQRLVEQLAGTEALLIHRDTAGSQAVWMSDGMRRLVVP